MSQQQSQSQMQALPLTPERRADLADYVLFRATDTPDAAIAGVVGFYFAACADAAAPDLESIYEKAYAEGLAASSRPKGQLK